MYIPLVIGLALFGFGLGYLLSKATRPTTNAHNERLRKRLTESEIGRQFLKQAMPPGTPVYKGETPLHIAVRNGHLDCVKSLLEFGADPGISRDHDNKTSFDLADEIGDEGLRKKMLSLLENTSVKHQIAEVPKT